MRFANIIGFLLLAFLWWHLINHLHIEWTVNPQYAYGWAVPLLCAWFAWERLREHRERSSACQTPNIQPPTSSLERTDARSEETSNAQRSTFNVGPAERVTPCAPGPQGEQIRNQETSHLGLQVAEHGTKSTKPLAFAMLCLAALWLPVRLIEEANPEWRLVSWALAFIVVGLTAGLIARRWGRPTLLLLAFPLAYFFVAVPWPTLIEAPVIQGLTRLNTALTIELLGVAGIPALQHGNVIEVRTGVVGVDEACSGIRSLQATLMIALALGEFYRLRSCRRLALVLGGWALAMMLNLGRTLLLVVVAARDGVPAIESWHDPAGITILIGCLFGLWGLAVWLGKREEKDRAETFNVQCSTFNVEDEGRSSEGGRATPRAPGPQEEQIRNPKSEIGETSNPPLTRPAPAPRALFFTVLPLIAWIAVAEVAVEAWYRSHEQADAGPGWTLHWPPDEPEFRELPFSEDTVKFLRFDEGNHGVWIGADGTRWEMYWLRWQAGKVAAHLARSHTPEVCLTAAGKSITSISDVFPVEVDGVTLPFQHYTFTDKRSGETVHVFYSLWQEGVGDQDLDKVSLTYGNRFGPVLAGIRNRGQRVIEAALIGPNDDAAQRALKNQLGRMLRPETKTGGLSTAR